ncbi:MAG: DNA primase [Proteobacteria bacterium]|nr:DNA primase [Pseudomonadota bacterium]
MRYPPSILEDIKARLPASAVVGRRVQLKKAGREWRGLSPFNAEKTPSFYVNDQKQAWFDFSSGRNGDIFTFLMEAEGLSFAEAVERLAGEAGVELPAATPETEIREKQRLGLYDAMSLAADYFRQELKGAKGREAREYMASRGLIGAVAERFGLGYAPPDRHGLRDFLAGKDVPVDVMVEAGLLIRLEDNPVAYDRFRDRVMFPIHDAKGRVIAFGGRALAKDAQAKYLNSPETPIFHKGATLYNLHRARKGAHDAGTLFVVEGYVDAIALDRAGIGHVVAPLGTALTEEQLALIWRMTGEPILCFDGDKAGLRAAYRAVDVALPAIAAGKTLRFVFLPNGQDPDDLLRAQGADALRAALEKPRPLVEVLFERETERSPLETPEQRADCEKRLFGAVAQIADEDLKRHYRQAMRERLQERFQPQQRTGRGEFRRRPPGERGAFRKGEGYQPPLVASEGLRRNPLLQPAPPVTRREAALVLAAIHHPAIIEAEAETFAELLFESAPARRLRAALLDCAAHPEAVSLADSYIARLLARGFGDALARIEEAASVESWVRPAASSEHALAAWREAALLHGRQSFLNTEIDSLSLDFVENGGEERFERLKALLQRREALLDSD